MDELLVDLLFYQAGLELKLRKSLKLPTPQFEIDALKHSIEDNNIKINSYNKQEVESGKLSVYIPYLSHIKSEMLKDITVSSMEKEKTIQAADEILSDILK